MKSFFSTGGLKRPVLTFPSSGAIRRQRDVIAQFPTPSGPTAYVLAAALVVLAATAAMMIWGGPDDAPQATSEQVEADADVGRAAVPEDEAALMADVRKREDRSDPVAEEPEPAPEQEEMSPPSVAVSPEPPLPEIVGSVAVADTVEEVLALEEIQRREVEADLASVSDEQTAAIANTVGPKVAAKATTWVNLRAGPADDAEVLLVVPGSADIEAQTGCNWCAVTYDGREGYIYKNFISYE
ncbi:MAG: SH3 domain-containing protein [Rhizobiaceae bacterium]|nr:SH3 domain-containing protein [Rhizobiaceae bacterium]